MPVFQKEKTMASKPVFRPGQEAPRSGQWEQIGPRGGRTGNERTVTRGEPLPPTPRPGMGYILVDPTKHGGRSK
ncbi:YjzC family protein [Schaalia sp. JY-X169]|uniref:YjzC family protein n=1 Tax=Schaalia sp. JY-X169 TaxID=2758572 RepID=UPI0037D9F6EF